MNRQDTSRHHPCRTHRCLAHFCSPVLHVVFSLYFIATAPVPRFSSPFKVFAVRPQGPQRTRWLGNAAGPIGVTAFLLWFARPVLDTRAAKTDRTPGGCSTSAACIHAPIRPPPAETTTPALPPHQHKVDERTSPSPAATAWPFACLIRRLFTARHQRKCSEPFKHQTALCTWHLGRPC
jgi:hypothetical protein